MLKPPRAVKPLYQQVPVITGRSFILSAASNYWQVILASARNYWYYINGDLVGVLLRDISSPLEVYKETKNQMRAALRPV